MEASKFVDSPFGAPTKTPGSKDAFTFYLPKPIPREISLDPATIMLLSAADAALGHLDGLGTLIADPSLLIGPYLRREALASSRIEGTQASLSEVFRSEIDAADGTADTAEVDRYLAATRQAYELQSKLPITQRLILPIHETLMRGVRGEEKRPGEFRTSPVWVGAVGATPDTAVFVPPLPTHLGELLSDWERFVNVDGKRMPPLVQSAVAHYQFETIHPFLDGNGRIGRLLISLVLHDRGRMRLPLLYLSHYFESHRDEYYAALQGVRERGDIAGWLRFFLTAVREQADDAVRRAAQLVDIRERYGAAARAERSNLIRLVEMILRNPFVTVRLVEETLELTNQGARALIRRAEGRGWLVSLGTGGRGGREAWVAREVLLVMESPMSYGG